MPNNNVALDIMEFIEQNILPKYAAFDKAHNLSHANSVLLSTFLDSGLGRIAQCDEIQ